MTVKHCCAFLRGNTDCGPIGSPSTAALIHHGRCEPVIRVHGREGDQLRLVAVNCCGSANGNSPSSESIPLIPTIHLMVPGSRPASQTARFPPNDRHAGPMPDSSDAHRTSTGRREADAGAPSRSVPVPAFIAFPRKHPPVSFPLSSSVPSLESWRSRGRRRCPEDLANNQHVTSALTCKSSRVYYYYYPSAASPY